MSKIKVCSKPSTVSNFGTGLFATTEIKKGSIIVEFKGKLRQSDTESTDNKKNIYFNDGSILECHANDLASSANDVINFTYTRRKLLESLRSDKPFYEKHPNTKINAGIKLNDKLHRAFLIAEDNITIGEEIFCHYGFDYWFTIEMTFVGFNQENEKFPEKIYQYPSFMAYIKNLYPKYIKHEIKLIGDNIEFIIYLDKNKVIIMPLHNYATQISHA
jgi:hypothetical protein